MIINAVGVDIVRRDVTVICKKICKINKLIYKMYIMNEYSFDMSVTMMERANKYLFMYTVCINSEQVCSVYSAEEDNMYS